MSGAIPVLNGATVMACTVAALFFLRFFRRTGERLFARFAASFGLLGLHWLALALTAPDYEFRPLLYVIRLLAFVVILFAIAEKNRAQTPLVAPATGSP
jgi:uncharacterized membrane protein